jgi:phage repressor protein C with HTH and peptisase S24 domain
MMNTTWNQRLTARMAELGISQGELARKVGISQPSVNDWVSGSTKSLRGTLLPAVAKALGTTPEWILTGRDGSREPDRPPYLRAIVAWHDAADLPPDQFAYLPKLDYYLSAGPGGIDPDAMEATDRVTPFRSDFMRDQGWTPQTHYTMRCKGESMEPTIQDGSPVVIDTAAKSIKSGSIYAVLIDGDPMLKRLDKLPGGLVRVRSDNTSPAYAPFEVAESSLQIIGRAVWTAGML